MVRRPRLDVELPPKSESIGNSNGLFHWPRAPTRCRAPTQGWQASRGISDSFGVEYAGITEAACKIVFTQRLKRSGMSWTIAGGQVILDLRVIWLSGVWDDVHQRSLASKPQPATQVDMAKGAQRGQQAA